MSNNTPLTKIHQSIILNNSHTGKRLDSAVTELFPDYSRAQIQKWIKDGCIKVDNKIQKPKYTVFGFETLDINIEILPTNEWIAEDIELDIVYEDDDIIVINKHANIVVHPGAGNPTGTISNALLNHSDKFQIIPRAGIVHRLDKDTTGLMVAAKTLIAYHSLVAQLSNRTVDRRYLAIVEGEIYESGIINKPIGRSSTNRTKMAVTNNGKEAITEYTPLEIYDKHTLIECKLQTGRTHQIRVHMKSIKNPLLGDQTYNKGNKNFISISDETNEVINRFDRQALHAYKLSFIHPISEKTMSFKAQLPSDMLELKTTLQEEAEYENY
jgi:23S rRNA pseudouridine1911/1915/1917 synthase